MEAIAQKLFTNNSIFQGDYSINFTKLRFKNHTVENNYNKIKIKQSINIIQLTIFFGTLAHLFFGILDYILMPEIYIKIWFLRYGVLCPICIACCLFSFHKNFYKYGQYILSIIMFSSVIGILGLIYLSPPPAKHLYFSGLIIVIIYPHLSRLDFLYGTFIIIITFILYVVSSIFLSPIEKNILLSNLFFLFMFSFIGIITLYIHEYYFRMEFISTQLISKAKEETETLLHKANAANHAKSEFLAVMSHELRTPLNAIVGFSEIISREMFGKNTVPQYKEYADDINRSGTHLLHIINDILDLSKAEAGKLSLEEEEFKIIDTLDETLRMLRQKAAQKGVRLIFHPPQENLLLFADKRLVYQCIINVITNAIKFSYNSTDIDISITHAANKDIVIHIQDDGVGIAPEDIERITEPFVQVESAYTRENEGTGLGLPLVKKIMELHNGAINIKSTIQQGTCVSLIFPAARNRTAYNGN